MAQRYKRFDGQSENGHEVDPKSIASSRNDGNTTINFTRNASDLAKLQAEQLRAWKILRILAAAGLLFSCSLVLFEAFVDTVIATDEDSDNFGVCGIGTGIWTGFLGVTAGTLGVCSFRTITTNKSLILAYFVVLVSATVADGILIILTAFCIDTLPYVRISHNWDNETHEVILVTKSSAVIPIDQLLYAVGALLMIASFIHSQVYVIILEYII